MGESRTELIAWLNDLLQVNYTKVEQCGTGGAYCQIMDSIFGKWATLCDPLFLNRRFAMLCCLCCYYRRRTHATSEDECETRVRVHWELQDLAKHLQVT